MDNGNKNILQQLRDARQSEREIKELKKSDYYKLNEKYFPGEVKYTVIEEQPKVLKRIHDVSDNLKSKIKAKWKVAVAVLVSAAMAGSAIGFEAKYQDKTNEAMDTYSDFIEYADTFEKEINQENYAEYLKYVHDQVDPEVYLDQHAEEDGGRPRG